MFLSHSNWGVFFNICNLSLLLFLSTRWKWNKGQLLLLLSAFILVFLKWRFAPPNTNANIICSITLFSLFFILLAIEYLLKQLKCLNLLNIILLAVTLPLLIEYQGRGALIAFFCYLTLRYLVPKSWWNNRLFYKLLCLCSTIGSIIFVGVYTYIWIITDSDWFFPILGKKIFSGREIIWYELWTLFCQRPLTGTGSNIVLKTFEEVNVHNTMYNILVMHGVIVFTLFVLFMLYKLLELYDSYRYHPLFITAMSVFFASWIQGYLESNLVWGPQLIIWSALLIPLNSAMCSISSISTDNF